MKTMRLLTLAAFAAFASIAAAGPLEDLDTMRNNTARPFVNVLRVASNVADTETVTINGTVFEADTDSTPTITAGRTRVNIVAAQTPTAFCDALVTAWGTVNMGGIATLTKISANEILITSPRAWSVAETLAGSNNAWAAATNYGGVVKPAVPRTAHVVTRTANATEVALGALRVVLPFNPTAATVTITTAGVAKAWDGAVTLTGNRVDLDNAGSVDWAAADVVTIVATN